MPRSKKRRPKTGGQKPAPSLQAALKAFEARNFAAATALCRKVVARDPANTDALNILGGAYLELGDTSEAIEVMMQAISLRPGDATIEANLGAVLATAKRFDEAEKYLSHALSLTPGDTDVMANLGYAQFELGQFDRAMMTFAAALALSPNNVNILIGAIRAAASGRDMAAAGKYARLALELDVQDPSTQRELTRVMYEYHQYPESLVYSAVTN
jgi:Tfp pilus assembly protein PilF